MPNSGRLADFWVPNGKSCRTMRRRNTKTSPRRTRREPPRRRLRTMRRKERTRNDERLASIHLSRPSLYSFDRLRSPFTGGVIILYSSCLLRRDCHRYFQHHPIYFCSNMSQIRLHNVFIQTRVLLSGSSSTLSTYVLYEKLCRMYPRLDLEHEIIYVILHTRYYNELFGLLCEKNVCRHVHVSSLSFG